MTGETGSTTITSGGTAGYTLTIGTGGITQAASTGTVTLGSTTAANNFTIDLGASQVWTNSTATSWVVDAAINGTAAASSTQTLTITGPAQLVGAIGDGSGGGAVALSLGGGTINVAGANTYSGGTTINSGIIQINNATAFGTGTLTINGGTLGLGASFSGTATLTNNNPIVIGGSFATSSTLPHSLNLGTGAVSLAGTNTTYTITSGNNTLTIGGQITGGSGDSITAAGGGGSTSPTLQLANVALTSGTLSTSGSINLVLGTTSGGSISGVTGITIGSNGTLTTEWSSGTNYGGTINISTASTSFFHPNEASGVTNTFSGAISGNGNLTHVGAGTAILATTNNYTGLTTASTGTLQIGNGSTGSISSSSTTSISSGATLILDLATGSTFSNTLTDNGTLNAMQSGTTTISSGFSGTGALTLTGTGTTILSNATTYNGSTTVGGSATLQLQNANALQDSALTLNNGSTLQLRANTASNSTTTTFAPTSIAAMSGASTLNFDVGNLLSGTGNTLALTGTLAFASNTSNQINVTNSTTNVVGGTTSGLALGTITNQGTTSGTYNFTINATTAPVSIVSFTASSFGTNLILEGGNNITFGSSATPTATTTLSSNSNGYFNTTVSGANVTIYGTYVNSGAGAHSLNLASGDLNLDSSAASGSQGFNISGGTLDNTSGGALTESGSPYTTISNSFTFAGSNSLNMGTGNTGVTGNSTVTVNANTLTLGGTTTVNAGVTLTKAGSGTLTLGGALLNGSSLADSGGGGFNTGGITILGTGNTIANSGTGVMALGTINNFSGNNLGTADFTPAATPTNLTSSGTNGSGNSTIISIMDTVNGGADFAAIGTGGAIVARNSIVAETALPAAGSSSSNVYFLTGSQTLTTATETVAALRINDAGTTDSLSTGAFGLTLGGSGGSGILYNGGTNGQYTISGTGYVGAGSNHTFSINTYAGTLTISAPLIDAGGGSSYDSLYKGGVGTLILTGANSFGGSNGGVIVGGGTLDLGNGNSGSFTGTFGSGPTVNAGSTLGIGLANGSTVAASIADSGSVVGNEFAGVTNTLSGGITGSGNLVQNGAGTTILSGSGASSPYFTGAVTINAGAIQIANAGALGSTAPHMTSGVVVNSGGALQISGGISTTGAYALTLNGTGVTGAANGALESVSGSNTWTGGITMGSAASIGADSTAALTVSGNVANGGNNLSVIGAGNTTLSGTISGSGGLTSTSSGTTTLSGTAANTYTGETNISAGELDLNKSASVVAVQGLGADNVASAPDILVNGGTLKFLASNQFPTVGHEVTLSLTSGTVSLNGTNQTVYAFSNSGGTFTTGAGYLTGTGATTTFSGGTNTINSGGTIEDSHFVISGGTNTVQAGGTLLLDGGGAGMQFSNGANLTLNSDNSSPGQLELASFGSSFAISSSAASTTATISSASGGSKAGTINLSSNELDFTVAAGTVAGGGPDLSIGAVIADGSGSGGGSITKSGNGILQLTAVNTYTGSTSVYAGTLNVTGSIANSTVSIASGATLSGTGTTGTVTMSGGSAINLRDGAIGTLHVGGLTVNGGTLSFDIGAGSSSNLDLIASTGALAVNGAATITIGYVSGTPTLTNGTYSLITYNNGGSALGSSAFGDLSLNTSALSGSGKIFTLVNNGGDLELNVAASVTNGQYTLTTTAGSLNVHANGGTTALSTTFTNTGTGTQDALNYNSLTATGTGVGSAGGTTSGSNIKQGASGSGSTTNTFTAGSSAGNVAISNSATVSNVTATGRPSPTNTGATINVYSGLSTWNTNGGGSWSTAGTGAYGAGANWGANQGAPGVTAGFANTDTATFDNTALAHNSSATVTLDGATPSLKAITFNTDPGSGYTIATGTPNTGSIALDGNSGNATVTVTSGSHVISAPVSLTTSATINVGSVSAVAQQLTVSGQISGNGGLSNTGSGNTIVTADNIYTGGTTLSGGKFYVNNEGGASYTAPTTSANRTLTPSNSTGSGTGTGSVTVNSGGTLAGSGTIASSTAGVTVNNGGTLASGGIQSGTSAGVGLTINSNLSSALVVNGGATLTFALGSTTAYNGGSGALNFGNPNTNSTYLSLTGTTVDQIFTNTTTADNIDLVDLTNGSMSVSLTLRSQNPYLLIQTTLGNDADFSNVWTTGGEGQNGYVLGVSTGVGNAYTAFNLAAYDINGNQINTTSNLEGLKLYLYNGDLEVVPEPGTWALMMGGLALLVTIQRRRNKMD